jgi:5-methyltetrahydrofolate--homocysteine methyltransferase
MEPLLQTIHKSVVAGEKANAEASVREALEAGIAPEEILNGALITAMEEVGSRFERGQFYIPEMLIAARAMQAGLSVIKPTLVEENVQAAGRVVIGTVKGDLHNIGKNLVAMMLEGAGFEIRDLGTDVSPEAFVAAVQEHKPDIVGISALLTTTMQNIKATLEALEEAGLGGKVKVIVGGAPLTQAFADEIGADGFAPDASSAVRLAKALV